MPVMKFSLRRRRALTCLVIAVAAFPAVGESTEPAESPPTFKSVMENAGSETEFVDALRAFDQTERVFIQSARQVINQLRASGTDDEIKTAMRRVTERRDRLRAAYEQALQRYPQNALLHTYYGEVLYDFYHEVDGAMREWHLAISFDPDVAPAHNNLGMELCHTGSYATGVHHLDTARELDPKNPAYLFNLVQIYLIHGPQVSQIRGWDKDKVYNEAMKLSRKAVQLRPDSFDYLQDYAVNFFAGENFGVDVNWKRAAAAWEAARAHAPGVDQRFYTWLNEARAWIRHGDNGNAERCLRAALTIKPGNDVVMQLLAKVVDPGPQ